MSPLFTPPSPRARRLAAVVSTLGHPLLTVGLFVGFWAFRQLAAPAAAWVTGAVAGGVLLPVAAWSYYQVRRGRYTNFDVSRREQRGTLYPLVLGLLGLATAGVWLHPAAAGWRAGMAVAGGLVLLCYGLNRRLKVSLHAALSFYLAGCLALAAGTGWGLLAAGLAGVIAASRVVLGRHTGPEVLVGSAAGLLAAAVLLSLR
ncbi:hypothetical protein EJV47_18130 [Hymenobacter gummosus]|uniref:Phosphatase PAP2 family protein n=1 Tax=Hymenobacter gummosus TaxID=1776032 RepID=A0A431TZE8_9BACT|nr:hypothetical protein [Hymenobacter gummosus]RTQ47837.1 hypothetical protein EJV47_18130 [Hymenobacter gummosus]